MSWILANMDPQLNPIVPETRVLLEKTGAEIIEKECVTESDVVNFAQGADAVVTSRAPITRQVIEQLNCRVIGRFGSGTDNVDHHAATDHNIVVVYVPDFCTEEVSNHALLLLLACNKKLVYLDKSVRQGAWGIELVSDIHALVGQTLGLVGFGRIAQALARKIQPLGLKVVGYDPFISDDVFQAAHVAKMDLADLLGEADYVSLHIPLTPETQNLIAQPQLAQMKSNAFLINCARGGVVNELDLFEALQKKNLAGAALDCLDQEPANMTNPLLQLENVIFTPHSAAYSHEAIAHLRLKTIQQVIDVLQNRRPEFVRNPEVLQKLSLTS